MADSPERAPEAEGALWHGSPNLGSRRDSARPSLVVLHYTAMDTAEAALARLCDPASEVSAHYLIAEDGRLWQMVRERDRAWHAGAGSWGTVRDVNSASLGIELASTGDHPYPAPQMATLERLLHGCLARWDIPPAGVIGHEDMAPGRKADPGPRFDWRRLARAGLSVWPSDDANAGNTASSPDAFDALVRDFGYTAGTPETRLAAFRRRFRPWARGPLTAADVVVARGLAGAATLDDEASGR